MSQSDTTLRLRIEEFDRHTSLRGWDTDAERARRLNISHATLTNIRSGKQGIGLRFVDACLREFGQTYYDVLFDRVPATAEPQVTCGG